MVFNRLKKLPKSVQGRIIKKVEECAENPFRFVKKLKGIDLYSLRVGDYRVILSLESRNLVIFVIEVGHRREIYRNF